MVAPWQIHKASTPSTLQWQIKKLKIDINTGNWVQPYSFSEAIPIFFNRLNRLFSGRSRSNKIGFLSISKFLFIVVTVISILLKTAIWHISIHSQSLVKILWRSNKDKITFKAIEKYRYGLQKTVLKHLKRHLITFLHFVTKQVDLIISCSTAGFRIHATNLKIWGWWGFWQREKNSKTLLKRHYTW